MLHRLANTGFFCIWSQPKLWTPRLEVLFLQCSFPRFSFHMDPSLGSGPTSSHKSLSVSEKKLDFHDASCPERGPAPFGTLWPIQAPTPVQALWESNFVDVDPDRGEGSLDGLLTKSIYLSDSDFRELLCIQTKRQRVSDQNDARGAD